MSKFAVLLFMVATCILGCRNVSPVGVMEAQEPPANKAKTGEWVAAMATISQKDSLGESAPPFDQARAGIPKGDHPEAPWVPTVESKLKSATAPEKNKDSNGESAPRVDQPNKGIAKRDHAERSRVPTMASKPKPPGAPEKKIVEKGISANPPTEKAAVSGIPRDVWYAIATIFGAVFTSLLAPIAVEIIRERIATCRQQAEKQQT